MNALLALLWLDLKRFWLNPLRLALSLVQPLLYLFVLGAGLGTATAASPGHYPGYLFPGVIALSLMFTASSAAVGIVFDRQVGFMKALMVAPVSRAVIAIGKILSGAILALSQAGLLLLFAPLAGVRFTLGSLLLFVLAMLIAALAFSALGLAVALPFRSVTVFPVVSNALLLPMFFLSGALYPLERAPAWLALTARFDPAAYGVDLLRGVLSGHHLYAPALSRAVRATAVGLPGWLVARAFRRAGSR
jgi:ABC-2 type transport system permease protein